MGIKKKKYNLGTKGDTRRNTVYVKEKDFFLCEYLISSF